MWTLPDCCARFTIRDCHARRGVGERMKAFEEFVSLFEDHEN
jgi:hypothetical protein